MKTLINSAQMARKNARSYLFLSMTVLLSFCFLLIYLVYYDSYNYNGKIFLEANEYYAYGYKDYQHLSSEMSAITFFDSRLTQEDIESNVKKTTSLLDNLEDTHYNVIYSVDKSSVDFKLDNCKVSLSFIDSHSFAYATVNAATVTRDIQKITTVLDEGEAFVNDTFYEFLTANTGEETPEITYRAYDNVTGKTVTRKIKIVGGVEDSLSAPTVEDGRLKGNIRIVAPYSELEYWDETLNIRDNLRTNAVIIVNSPTQYQGIIKTYVSANTEHALTAYFFEEINSYRATVCSNIQQRALILCFFYIVLAINLYGSFRNALNERKFEIGVRRAIGASKKDIMGQFMLEGMLVILMNMLASIYIVSVGFFVFKEIIKLAMGIDFILYISWGSVLSFFIICISLAMLFSAIFAYQTTRVNVIDNLRAE